MLLKTLLIAGCFYIAALVALSTLARKKQTKTRDSKNYLMAGSNLGALLGFFTFAATLFSTFTLLGMPDFFRVNGVGAWIFLAVSDAVMIFGIVWLGYYFRRKANKGDYYGMAGFIKQQYQSNLAGYIAFLGAFIFLTPYVAIQIRGVAIFLNAAFPDAIPVWAWASLMVLVMLIYSEVGGLKAIIYSDAMQGMVLLIVIWIIGISCLQEAGGLEKMFTRIESQNPALLSTPGPKGLFDFQFLFGSMVAIMMLPFTQPQVSTRVAIMRNDQALYRMAIGVGFFAILIILPTIFVGMYGAINYPDASTADFLGNALVKDQIAIVGALVMIGLVAAAISTSDSQIFALGSEMRSLLTGDDQQMVFIARICIGVFAVIALVFALLSSDELVLLARTSFAGTAIMAPMIMVAIFFDRPDELKWLPPATAAGILLFIGSQFNWLPATIGGLRLDLLLLGVLALMAGLGVWRATSKTADSGTK